MDIVVEMVRRVVHIQFGKKFVFTIAETAPADTVHCQILPGFVHCTFYSICERRLGNCHEAMTEVARAPNISTRYHKHILKAPS